METPAHLRQIAFLAVFLFSFSTHATLLMEGRYQGENLYIQVPLNTDGFGFCATKVMVNGNIFPASCSSYLFEIDFSRCNVKIGDSIFVTIEHTDDCDPKVLNPEAILASRMLYTTRIPGTPEDMPVCKNSEKEAPKQVIHTSWASFGGLKRPEWHTEK